MKRSLMSFLAIAGLVTPVMAQTTEPQSFEAAIAGAKGEPIGKLMIRGGPKVTLVRIAIDAGGLTPGWHGLHFHAVGDCSDAGEFKLSMGHVNHGDSKHGLLNPEGPDDGDLPNIFANADGSAYAEVTTALLLAGDNGLKDADGTALVIHAGEDDQTSQPIGNAGARVGCAVVK